MNKFLKLVIVFEIICPLVKSNIFWINYTCTPSLHFEGESPKILRMFTEHLKVDEVKIYLYYEKFAVEFSIDIKIEENDQRFLDRDDFSLPMTLDYDYFYSTDQHRLLDFNRGGKHYLNYYYLGQSTIKWTREFFTCVTDLIRFAFLIY